MTREEMRYKLNELRMMLNDGEHGEEQGILVDIIKELDKAESAKTDTAEAEGEIIPDMYLWDDDSHDCPFCHSDMLYDYGGYMVRSNFCPNCGEDMRMRKWGKDK